MRFPKEVRIPAKTGWPKQTVEAEKTYPPPKRQTACAPRAFAAQLKVPPASQKQRTKAARKKAGFAPKSQPAANCSLQPARARARETRDTNPKSLVLEESAGFFGPLTNLPPTQKAA